MTASLAPGRCNVLMEHDGFAVEIDGNRCPRPGRAAVLDEVNTAGLVYVFPGGELDSARHRLLVDGELIELEPKAFAVLEDLLAHAGAMRSRDDLLDAVWGHRHVTPAVLNRCIGQVRKALGDHADAPRFVRTVHTLGYTFIAPVEVRGETAGPLPEAPAAAALPPRDVPDTPARRPRRRILGWALAAIAVLTFGWLAIPRVGNLPRPAADVVANAPKRVVIERFTVPSAAADVGSEVRAVESLLRQRLAASPGLRVDADASDAGAVRVSGHVVGVRGQWRLEAGVREPGASKDAWRRAYPLRLAALGATATELQDDLLRELRPDTAAILAGGAPPIDAQQFVRSGERAATGLQQRDRSDAIANFRRALELDPANAEAWCRLGEMYLMGAEENQRSVDEALPPAANAIGRGLRLDPASALCLQTRGSLLRLQGRTEEAETHFKRALALDPGLFSATVALVDIENDRRHFARARSLLEQLVEAHPERAWPHAMLVTAYDMTGDPDAARALEPVIYARHPKLRQVNWPSGSVELNYGNVAEGLRRYRQIAESDPEDRDYRLVMSYWASMIGATALAKSELDAAGVIEAVHYPLAHTWLLFALGDPASAVDWLRRTHLPPSLALLRRGWLAQALALAGRRDEALAEYARVYEDGFANGDATMTSLGAWSYSAQLLNYATLLGPGARRDAAVNAAAKQLAEFRSNGLGLPWVHYQAAQIAVLRGDVDGAMAHFDRALEAGYTDQLALYRDLAWREVAQDPRVLARKTRLTEIAAEQRRLLAAADSATVRR